MNDGKLAEIKAIEHFTSKGYEIYLPFGGCGTCDFIALKDGEPVRVEVKSTVSRRDSKAEKQSLDLRRQRNNTTKGRTNFDGTKSDLVFAINLNTGNVRIEKSMDLHGRSGLRI